jgi:hypothetical protein
MLDRSLLGLSTLIDEVLAEVRVASGAAVNEPALI